MEIEDNYASWLNHKWLKNHIQTMEILKPTDNTDPDYEERIRIWQTSLSIPKELRDKIRKIHEEESLKIYFSK